jgi:hypothetical protein
MPKHDGDEERPKRSWREIDKMRDKGFARAKARDERSQEKLSRSPVYEQYKAKVSKMFSGGEIPDVLREKLDPSGEIKARDELLKKLKKAATEDRKAWAESVTEFVQKFEMPEDAYLLVDWLDHPKDRVVEKSLSRLEELASAGLLAGPKCPKSIDQRLRSLELMGTDPDIQAKAKSLRERLRS